MMALIESQMNQVKDAARTLLPSERDNFLQGLARRLGESPSDEAVQLAISAQLAVNRLPTFVGCK